MELQRLDDERMRQALELAHEAIGLSDPNPRVGCVIGDAQGRIFGTGFTQQVGGPHAEVMALRAAREAQCDLRGATAWVTLEPCAHHGRTPPCCDALIEAGIGRVVAAAVDPFPKVAGTGLQRLTAKGIDVVLAGDAAANASRELNIGYFSRIERQRPWVRAKIAMSLDGCTALLSGQSQWITGEAARADGHAWRKRASAILTGIGTVIADDPRLDVRAVRTTLQPLRVVVDSQLRTPRHARVLQPPGEVIVATSQAAGTLGACEGHVEVVQLPGTGGSVDLIGLLGLLSGRGVNELHVEAGETLTGALIELELVDELLVYCAPILLGHGHRVATLENRSTISQAPRFSFLAASLVGPDLRLLARRVDRGA